MKKHLYVGAMLVLGACGSESDSHGQTNQPSDAQAEQATVQEMRTTLLQLQADLQAAQKRTQELETYVNGIKDPMAFCQRLAEVARVDDGGDVIFEGANLHIRSGSGSTSGNTNGKGNLIIGYNEMSTDMALSQPRTGSHNLVVGSYHAFSSYGGVVFGDSNAVLAPHGTILGGVLNKIETRDRIVATDSTIVGGSNNFIMSPRSTIGGGKGGVARGDSSSIVGGLYNVSEGEWSVVLGGQQNRVAGQGSVILGGSNRVFEEWYEVAK